MAFMNSFDPRITTSFVGIFTNPGSSNHTQSSDSTSAETTAQTNSSPPGLSHFLAPSPIPEPANAEPRIFFRFTEKIEEKSHAFFDYLQVFINEEKCLLPFPKGGITDHQCQLVKTICDYLNGTLFFHSKEKQTLFVANFIFALLNREILPLLCSKKLCPERNDIFAISILLIKLCVILEQAGNQLQLYSPHLISFENEKNCIKLFLPAVNTKNPILSELARLLHHLSFCIWDLCKGMNPSRNSTVSVAEIKSTLPSLFQYESTFQGKFASILFPGQNLFVLLQQESNAPNYRVFLKPAHLKFIFQLFNWLENWVKNHPKQSFSFDWLCRNFLVMIFEGHTIQDIQLQEIHAVFLLLHRFLLYFGENAFHYPNLTFDQEATHLLPKKREYWQELLAPYDGYESVSPHKEKALLDAMDAAMFLCFKYLPFNLGHSFPIPAGLRDSVTQLSKKNLRVYYQAHFWLYICYPALAPDINHHLTFQQKLFTCVIMESYLSLPAEGFTQQTYFRLKDLWDLLLLDQKIKRGLASLKEKAALQSALPITTNAHQQAAEYRELKPVEESLEELMLAAPVVPVQEQNALLASPKPLERDTLKNPVLIKRSTQEFSALTPRITRAKGIAHKQRTAKVKNPTEQKIAKATDSILKLRTAKAQNPIPEQKIAKAKAPAKLYKPDPSADFEQLTSSIYQLLNKEQKQAAFLYWKQCAEEMFERILKYECEAHGSPEGLWRMSDACCAFKPEEKRLLTENAQRACFDHARTALGFRSATESELLGQRYQDEMLPSVLLKRLQPLLWSIKKSEIENHIQDFEKILQDADAFGEERKIPTYIVECVQDRVQIIPVLALFIRGFFQGFLLDKSGNAIRASGIPGLQKDRVHSEDLERLKNGLGSDHPVPSYLVLRILPKQVSQKTDNGIELGKRKQSSQSDGEVKRPKKRAREDHVKQRSHFWNQQSLNTLAYVQRKVAYQAKVSSMIKPLTWSRILLDKRLTFKSEDSSHSHLEALFQHQLNPLMLFHEGEKRIQVLADHFVGCIARGISQDILFLAPQSSLESIKNALVDAIFEKQFQAAMNTWANWEHLNKNERNERALAIVNLIRRLSYSGLDKERQKERDKKIETMKTHMPHEIRKEYKARLVLNSVKTDADLKDLDPYRRECCFYTEIRKFKKVMSFDPFYAALTANEQEIPLESSYHPRIIFASYSRSDLSEKSVFSKIPWKLIFFDEIQEKKKKDAFHNKTVEAFLLSNRDKQQGTDIVLSAKYPLEFSLSGLFHLLEISNPGCFPNEFVSDLEAHLAAAIQATKEKSKIRIEQIIQAFLQFHITAKIIKPLLISLNESERTWENDWEAFLLSEHASASLKDFSCASMKSHLKLFIKLLCADMSKEQFTELSAQLYKESCYFLDKKEKEIKRRFQIMNPGFFPLEEKENTMPMELRTAPPPLVLSAKDYLLLPYPHANEQNLSAIWRFLLSHHNDQIKNSLRVLENIQTIHPDLRSLIRTGSIDKIENAHLRSFYQQIQKLSPVDSAAMSFAFYNFNLKRDQFERKEYKENPKARDCILVRVSVAAGQKKIYDLLIEKKFYQ
jgi:hypothetical protein